MYKDKISRCLRRSFLIDVVNTNNMPYNVDIWTQVDTIMRQIFRNFSRIHVATFPIRNSKLRCKITRNRL